MRQLTAIAIILASALPAAADDIIILSPAQIGQVFCIARLGNDMAPVEGLLTSGLRAAIDEAETRSDAMQQQAPDDKPPLGDGVPWQSFQDYADQCSAGAVTLMQDEARVAIDYGFKDYPEAAFSDSLHLLLVDDPTVGAKVWRIDDIAYGADGNLRKSLVEAFLPN